MPLWCYYKVKHTEHGPKAVGGVRAAGRSPCREGYPITPEQSASTLKFYRLSSQLPAFPRIPLERYASSDQVPEFPLTRIDLGMNVVFSRQPVLRKQA